jgi:nitrogenase molybdenum-iron protein beta chain
MSTFIDRPRYLCALGGAVATLTNLPRVIPILHAAGGCGGNIANALNNAGGYAGTGYCGGQSLPSSNIYERDIVFGGEERLDEQIETTMKIIDGGLYFVVTGCMVEMIGDDVSSVVKRCRNGHAPVLSAVTGGFLGTSSKGYDIVLETLIRHYVTKTSRRDRKTVNLWGIMPVQDVFWKGNLNSLKRLIGKLGYKVNTFFGEGETLDTLKNSGKAALNIVVSDIYGIEPARAFEEVHGVPYLSAPLPIGPHGTDIFLRTLADALRIKESVVEAVIKEEKSRFYDYLERVTDVYNDLDLQRYAVVVGDANYTQALTRFLADDLGWLPELAVVTDDDLPDEQREALSKRFAGYASGITPELVFDTDTSAVAKHLSNHWPRNKGQHYYDSFNPAFVIGSVFERDLAESLDAGFLSVTYPVSNRVVLDRAYAGYAGALRLTEDIFTVLVAGR